MDYIDFVLLKAFILCAAAFIGNFAYSFVTGQSLKSARRGTSLDTQPPVNP